MMKPFRLGDTGFVVQAATKAAIKTTLSYQQYWVMSRAVCGQPVLDVLRNAAYDWTVLEKRPKGNTDAITNYEAFDGHYYREVDPMEHKKHRSVTLGFR